MLQQSRQFGYHFDAASYLVGLGYCWGFFVGFLFGCFGFFVVVMSIAVGFGWLVELCF